MDVWSFLRQLEPRGFLAARVDRTVVGYAIFSSSLGRVQRRAISSGAALRWAFSALRGGFALRPAALGRVLLNKLFFLWSGRRFRTQGDAQLINVAVHPSQHGRGVARALLCAGLDAMRNAGVREVRLEVRPWNARAVRLYERTGWVEIGRTRDAEGEWVVMAWREEEGRLGL